MKIGLVGEASSDTEAIKNLFLKRYPGHEFVALLSNLTGSAMDSKQFIAKWLPKEFHEKSPDLVILIRDLDSHEKDTTKLKERQKQFVFFNQKVANKGLFLLNIYELEALILADIAKFNKSYGCSMMSSVDPMKVADPKGELIKASMKGRKRFDVSHNPEIFKQLDFDIVRKNCRYFDFFVERFEEAISA